jgi:hypothetical protein
MKKILIYFVSLIFVFSLIVGMGTFNKSFAMDKTKLSELRAEIDADPLGLGYSGQDSHWVADKLNEIGASNEFVDRGFIDTSELTAAIDYTEYATKTSIQKDTIKVITTSGDGKFSINDAEIWAALLDIFGGGSNTMINIQAIAETSVSRADALNLGGPVYFFNVEQALLLVIP